MRKLLKFLLTIGALFILWWNFINIKLISHSVSGTLINFIPIMALIFVIYLLAYIIINDLDLIFSKDHKFQRR